MNERFIDAFHSVVSYANSRALQIFACKLAESAKIILLVCLKKKDLKEKERIEPVSLSVLKIDLTSVLMRSAVRYARSRRKKKKKINKSF